MKAKTSLISLITVMFSMSCLYGQNSTYRTLLPERFIDEIVGEASGETAWNTIMETGGYNKNRPAAEYKENFYEVQYIYDQLKMYGLPGTEIVRFPGSQTWDGIKGELWEISPGRKKIALLKAASSILLTEATPVPPDRRLPICGSVSLIKKRD